MPSRTWMGTSAATGLDTKVESKKTSLSVVFFNLSTILKRGVMRNVVVHDRSPVYVAIFFSGQIFFWGCCKICIWTLIITCRYIKPGHGNGTTRGHRQNQTNAQQVFASYIIITWTFTIISIITIRSWLSLYSWSSSFYHQMICRNWVQLSLLHVCTNQQWVWSLIHHHHHHHQHHHHHHHHRTNRWSHHHQHLRNWHH